METFIKCASVLKIVFEENTIKYRRDKVKRVIERHLELHQPYTSLNTCFV